jgi:hypothetical protein
VTSRILSIVSRVTERSGYREMTITMSRAAAGRAAGDTGTLDLGEIRFHWGEAYHVGRDGRMWTARRRDGRGGKLADPSPGGLLLAIRADYAACPVPRDLP